MIRTKLALAAMIMLTAFAACKKGDSSPKDSFDPAQYYIVMPIGRSAETQLLTFNISGKCIDYQPGAKGLEPIVYDYQYKDGHIKLVTNSKGDFIEFTISNEQLQKITVSGKGDVPTENIGLYKIPKDDAFAGKTFRGSYYSKEDNILPKGNTSILFNNGLWISGNVSDEYNLLNNAIATTTDAGGNKFFFAIVNGRLLFYNVGYNTYGILDEVSGV